MGESCTALMGQCALCLETSKVGPEGLIDLQRGTNGVHGNRMIKFSPG